MPPRQIPGYTYDDVQVVPRPYSVANFSSSSLYYALLFVTKWTDIQVYVWYQKTFDLWYAIW